MGFKNYVLFIVRVYRKTNVRENENIKTFIVSTIITTITYYFIYECICLCMYVCAITLARFNSLSCIFM